MGLSGTQVPGASSWSHFGIVPSSKVLGSEHPHTATSLNNLALLFQDQGDLATARPLFERAVAITATVLIRLGEPASCPPLEGRADWEQGGSGCEEMHGGQTRPSRRSWPRGGPWWLPLCSVWRWIWVSCHLPSGY